MVHQQIRDVMNEEAGVILRERLAHTKRLGPYDQTNMMLAGGGPRRGGAYADRCPLRRRSLGGGSIRVGVVHRCHGCSPPLKGGVSDGSASGRSAAEPGVGDRSPLVSLCNAHRGAMPLSPAEK
jgi:hypothetical protein